MDNVKENFEGIKHEDGHGFPTHAHVSLSRLGGCNYRVPVTYKGKSVYLDDPMYARSYRINLAKFIAGDFQIRDSSWAIRRFDDRSARNCNAEQNWQT